MKRNRIHLLRRAAAVVCVIATLTSCRSSSDRVVLTPADVQLRQIGDAILYTHTEWPTLIGFKDHESFASAGFSRRSSEETNLIVARLYLDATQAVPVAGSGTVPPLERDRLREQMRGVFSQRRPAERFGRDALDTLLEDTQQRMAADAGYRAQIDTALHAAHYRWNEAWNDYKCLVDGVPASIWVCRTLVLADAADIV